MIQKYTSYSTIDDTLFFKECIFLIGNLTLVGQTHDIRRNPLNIEASEIIIFIAKGNEHNQKSVVFVCFCHTLGGV